MALSFGGSIAKYDKNVSALLAENSDFEKSAIDQYKTLKQFMPQRDTSYKKDLLKIFEEEPGNLKDFDTAFKHFSIIISFAIRRDKFAALATEASFNI